MDKAAAEKFIAEQDEKIAELTKEIKALGMKASVKEARAEKNKVLVGLKKDAQYLDAKLIMEGKEPTNMPAGGYAAAREAGAAPETAADSEAKAGKEKKEKPKKAMEGAGISPEERKELEGLKEKIIQRKKELKEQGMSGGQMNKEATIVEWVKRMNELKEKECPGSSMSEKDKKKDEKKKSKKGGSLSSEEQAEMNKLHVEIEQYKQNLKTECGYTKKDMDKDPDLQEMLAKLKDFESRA